MTTKSNAKTTPDQPKSGPDCLGQEFLITREFNAPRELVWQACTEARHLSQWWGPRGFTAPVCEWDARPGNKIHVVMRAPNGMEFPMGGQFIEVAPPGLLVTVTGALDADGKMMFEIKHTMTLVELRGKTKLTMHSRVIKTTPGAGKYIGGFEAGMTQSLERLTDLLNNLDSVNTKTAVKPLIVERTIHAPVAKVWHALTTEEHIYRWFFELKEFKPEVGFTFEFTVEHEGFTYVHHCKITEVIPQKRLAYTWRYVGHEGDSLVSFELSPEGSHTRLKLTHEGLETFPKTPAFVRSNFLQGWTFLSNALAEFVESPTSDRDTVISRIVNAPRELVWEAMTNPKHVVNWWGPRGFTCAIENMDFRIGGVWKQTMRGPDGTNYDNEHVFTEIVKPERIVFSHGGKREDGASVRSVATWTFETVESNKTKVTIHMVFPTAANRDFVVKEFRAIEGGRQTLERLGEYVTKM